MPFNGYATPIATQAWQGPHPKTGESHRISVFTSHVPQGFELVKTGFDVEWSGDGTVGRGREPFSTLQEAEDWARSWNDQRVTSYLDVTRNPPPVAAGTPISVAVYTRWGQIFPGGQHA